MNEASKLLMVAIASAVLTALALPMINTLNSNQAQPETTVNPPVVVQTNPSENLSDFYQSLTEQLTAERETRQALEQEVEWLQSILDEVATTANAKINSATRLPKPANSQLWFDEKALQALDIDEDEIDRIRAAVNKADLDKLYLRNQASRDGRFRGKSFIDEMKKIQRQLRANLSEQGYDRMLFATGQNNRVSVSDTLNGSPAATAGINANDIILSYAGERIYQPNHLFQATTKGEVGEMIAVEILRNNERSTVYVPRGPLGTRFKSIRTNPR